MTISSIDFSNNASTGFSLFHRVRRGGHGNRSRSRSRLWCFSTGPLTSRRRTSSWPTMPAGPAPRPPRFWMLGHPASPSSETICRSTPCRSGSKGIRPPFVNAVSRSMTGWSSPMLTAVNRRLGLCESSCSRPTLARYSRRITGHPLGRSSRSARRVGDCRSSVSMTSRPRR